MLHLILPFWPAPTRFFSPSFLSPSLPSHPPFFFFFFFFFYLYISCPQITGIWGGLSETCVEVWRRPDGKPFVKLLALDSPKEPEPVGEKNSQWVQRQKLIGFLQDIIFHWMGKKRERERENFSPLNSSLKENRITELLLGVQSGMNPPSVSDSP